MTEETYLKRGQVPGYLEEHFNVGFTKSTLAKMAVRGDGPPFRKVGRRHAMYPVSDLEEWMREQFGPKQTSTNEQS